MWGLQVTAQKALLVPVGKGWANNTVNVTVYRKNSLVTHNDTQYIAYYNPESYVVLGKRKLGDVAWQLQQTPYRGNTKDAHNIISIMVDGDGYLHMAWDHHNNPLHYVKSVQPGSLVLTEPLSMTGSLENRLSYPEFYTLPNGNLLFFYRHGGSGSGNLVINQYNIKTKSWTQLHSNLIDGEQQRNAYWQACVDARGTIHLSWVWRETPDVASNHDMCYARSTDGGVTWESSNGNRYALPINAATAEYAWHIPQQSELINQTAMFADDNGYPYIATYWREKGSKVPQYGIIYKKEGAWQAQLLTFRNQPFSLSGEGSKSIPIARPQVVARQKGRKLHAALIFRDEAFGSKVSVACTKNLTKNKWKIRHLTSESVGSWEPSYDTELWKDKKLLHLFVQKAEQVDGEGLANKPPQPVQVLEWKPRW